MPNRTFPSGRCARCGVTEPATTMSRFNLDELCLSCSDDEKEAPGYAAAAAAELASVKSGNFNFYGVGLSERDVAFLRAKIAARPAAVPKP